MVITVALSAVALSACGGGGGVSSGGGTVIPTPGGGGGGKPTSSPSAKPTSSPTQAPTQTPSPVPTSTPTIAPTASPTPTSSPTSSPVPCLNGQFRLHQSVREDLHALPAFRNAPRMLMYTRDYMRSHPQSRFTTTQNLTYGGGAVQTSPQIYLTFWGWQSPGDTTADPDGLAQELLNFYTSMSGNAWINTTTQYYELVNGSAQCISNPTTQIAGVWFDPTPPPKTYSQDDIQREAYRAEQRFGYSANANYLVATPTGYTTSGFVSQFCAYHTVWQDPHGNQVAFTAFPYIPDAGSTCGAGSVNKPGTLDGVSIIGGHEEAEVQTDPVPGYGWGGPNGEIADACQWQNLEDNPNAGFYPTQPLWDNVAAGCRQSGP